MTLTDEQIGAEVHALRELPTEQFAAELDAWAAEGFPKVSDLESSQSESSSTRKRGLSGVVEFGRRRPAFAALVGAAAVVMVVGAGVVGYLREANNTAEPLRSKDGIENFSAKPSPARPGPDVAASGGTASALQPVRPRNGHPQVQERSASLGLSTDAGKLEDAANGVVQVTERYDGIVDSSTVHAGGSNGHASLSLRIPTQHLNDAMTDLSDLGRVTTRDTGSTNVTGAYVDAGKAYADARAKVDSLLEQLNSASPSEAPSIRIQLDAARQQLAATRAALGGLKQRVAYTPVSVEITAQGDGSWSIGDAADDAVGVLEAIAGAALIALAILVPLAALIALGWLGAREFNRRRREAPLDR